MAKPPTNPETEPARKPVDKLPAGSVRVGLDTVVLTEEQARAVFHSHVSTVAPANLREMAAEVRAFLADYVSHNMRLIFDDAVKVYRDHLRDEAIAAAEKLAKEAAAEVERLKAQKPANAPSPLAVEPEGGAARLAGEAMS